LSNASVRQPAQEARLRRPEPLRPLCGHSRRSGRRCGGGRESWRLWRRFGGDGHQSVGRRAVGGAGAVQLGGLDRAVSAKKLSARPPYSAWSSAAAAHSGRVLQLADDAAARAGPAAGAARPQRCVQPADRAEPRDLWAVVSSGSVSARGHPAGVAASPHTGGRRIRIVSAQLRFNGGRGPARARAAPHHARARAGAPAVAGRRQGKGSNMHSLAFMLPSGERALLQCSGRGVCNAGAARLLSHLGAGLELSQGARAGRDSGALCRRGVSAGGGDGAVPRVLCARPRLGRLRGRLPGQVALAHHVGRRRPRGRLRHLLEAGRVCAGRRARARVPKRSRISLNRVCRRGSVCVVSLFFGC
jgi:hypothetical protein